MSLSKKKKTEKMLKIAEAQMNIKVECKGQKKTAKKGLRRIIHKENHLKKGYDK